jgi:CBS domain-containing protein
MEPADIQHFLKGTAPFSYLDEASFNTVLKAISVFYCAAEDTVTMEKDQLLIVRSGTFSLLDQQQHRYGQLQEGDCAGHERLLEAEGGSESAVCEEDGLIFWLSGAVFRDCVRGNPHFAGYFQGLARRTLHQYRAPGDTQRFTQKVGDVITNLKVVIAPDQRIQDAAALMTEKRVSSLLVERNGHLVGIVTDRDLRSRVLAQGLDGSTPVSAVMTPDPQCIERSAYVFEAVQLMSQHNIHHLPVLDRGTGYGMITLTDVVRAQQSHPVYVIGNIHRQTHVDGLRQCTRQTRHLLEELGRQQVPAYEVAHIITTITDALTQRLVRLAEQTLGKPPCGFCWLAFGSQARMDQSINADQDNALLLAEEPRGQIAEYFTRMADFVCNGLAHCGITLCPGNIMASNPELRLGIAGWQRKFSHFIQAPDPTSVLGSSIFFDLRGITGDLSLVTQLRQHIHQIAKHNDLFLFHLARTALERTPPLSMLRNFVLEQRPDGETGVDLKKRGMSIITDIVRVYAIAEAVEAVNTRQRLQQLVQQRALDPHDGQNLLDAFDVITQLRWQKHQQQINRENPPGNLVDPVALHSLQREQLKDSFLVISKAQAALKNRFCRNL